MRRALFALSSTIAGLVMLLSFKTQAPTITTPPAALGTPVPGTTGAAPSPDPTSPAASGSAAPRTGASGVSTAFGSRRRRHHSQAASGTAMWKATDSSALSAIG